MTFHAWSLFFLRLGAWLLVGGASGLVVWGIFDLVAIARGELAGNSISLAAQRALYAAPPGLLIVVTAVIVLVIGVLLGHFGWPQYRSAP
ncbi:hypothetical protein [Anaeromyxobacter oryzisoli]|uniref:hypothetical protein n=1 Tax=Anaeromyxobacter oryzisoli TaxID=2925408 RepID=UPI001F58FF8E|nr:hypothetical protein [Anaeromyxobacter sp. SG63]